MHELMFQAGVKGMSERSELIPCNDIYIPFRLVHLLETSAYASIVLILASLILKLPFSEAIPEDFCTRISQLCDPYLLHFSHGPRHFHHHQQTVN